MVSGRDEAGLRPHCRCGQKHVLEIGRWHRYATTPTEKPELATCGIVVAARLGLRGEPGDLGSCHQRRKTCSRAVGNSPAILTGWELDRIHFDRNRNQSNLCATLSWTRDKSSCLRRKRSV